jgi:hypothetical protein
MANDKSEQEILNNNSLAQFSTPITSIDTVIFTIGIILVGIKVSSCFLI